MYKNILISVITIFTVIELGTLILDKTKFEAVFKNVSGIMIIITVISLLTSCNTGFSNDYFKNSDSFEHTNNINAQIVTNIENMIKEDLHNKFYVNYNVRVKTDLKTLKIYIQCTSSEKNKEIKNYIQDKYCSPEDEVIFNDKIT